MVAGNEQGENMQLELTPDELLTTTRTVRKRLDLERPVERDVLVECVELAIQAPSGGNQQGRHWFFVDDPAKKLAIGEIYKSVRSRAITADLPADADPEVQRIRTSGEHLTAHLHEVPVLMIPLPGGLPAVFHCANGKDRTGLSAALLLELLGVPRDDILDDYELSGRYLDGTLEPAISRLVATGMGPDAAAVAMGTPRAVMAATLGELDTTYGGITRYLADRAGVALRDLASLRELLLR